MSSTAAPLLRSQANDGPRSRILSMGVRYGYPGCTVHKWDAELVHAGDNEISPIQSAIPEIPCETTARIVVIQKIIVFAFDDSCIVFSWELVKGSDRCGGHRHRPENRCRLQQGDREA